jgi:hypothetical protein
MLRFLIGDKARLEYSDVSSQRVQFAKKICRALAVQHVITAEATAWHSERTLYASTIRATSSLYCGRQISEQ